MLRKLATAFAALPLAAQVTITTVQSDIPTGTVGANYLTSLGANFSFAASGGMPPYSWSVTLGAIPPGLTLTPSGANAGRLSGTPQGCSDFWSGASPTPCNFPALYNNTFNPMSSDVTIQVTDSTTPAHLTAQKAFNVPVFWDPDESTYFSGQYANFTLMVQSTSSSAPAGSQVPPIPAGGHLVIANPFFRDARYDNQVAWNAWVDAMKAAGMSIVNIEVDLECLVVNRPTCLALYAGAIKHAHQLGMSVSINPAYYTTGNDNADPSCGAAGCPGGTVGGIGGACAAALGHAINSGTIGTTYGSGVTDWYTCLVSTVMSGSTASPYRYILENWLESGDRFVPVHEPTTSTAQWKEGVGNDGATDCNASATSSVNQQSCGGQPLPAQSYSRRTCPQDWWVNFLEPFFSAVTSWSVPAGITYGVTVNAREMGTTAAYADYFETNIPTSVVTGSDTYNVQLGLDMYDFESDRQTLFKNTILMFQGISPSGPAHQVFSEEFGPQAWTYTDGKTGEACAIVGMQSCIWNTFNQNFLPSVLSFVSALGVTDASLYGANLLGACAPTYPDNPNDDNAVLDTATTAMEKHQYSMASAHLNRVLAQWNKTGITGSKLTGLISLMP